MLHWNLTVSNVYLTEKERGWGERYCVKESLCIHIFTSLLSERFKSSPALVSIAHMVCKSFPGGLLLHFTYRIYLNLVCFIYVRSNSLKSITTTWPWFWPFWALQIIFRHCLERCILYGESDGKDLSQFSHPTEEKKNLPPKWNVNPIQ